MKLSARQLRRIIKEELNELYGSAEQTHVGMAGNKKLRYAASDAKMALDAAQRAQTALTDGNKEEAARWLQKLQSFAQKAAQALQAN